MTLRPLDLIRLQPGNQYTHIMKCWKSPTFRLALPRKGDLLRIKSTLKLQWHRLESEKYYIYLPDGKVVNLSPEDWMHNAGLTRLIKKSRKRPPVSVYGLREKIQVPPLIFPYQALVNSARYDTFRPEYTHPDQVLPYQKLADGEEIIVTEFELVPYADDSLVANGFPF